MKTIYVDLDGTLTVEDEGYGEDVYASRTPRPDIIQFINNWYPYAKIVIWTARYEEDRKVTEEWLHKHGVRYHELILNKPKFDLYICDRVVNVNDLFEVQQKYFGK